MKATLLTLVYASSFKTLPPSLRARTRRRRLAQLQNRLLDGREEQADSENKGKEGKEDLLRRVFVGRAWEVFQATQKQYPQVAKRLGEVLAQLVSSGK